MSGGQVMLVLVAGLAAGLINAIVGAGTLLTFPALLAAGYAPLVANVSNTVGLAVGSAGSVAGYRRELSGQGRRIVQLATPSVLGAVTGSALLLALPARVFGRVVPILVLLAVALVLVQPGLGRLLAERRAHRAGRWALMIGIYLVGIYGGYFGAAQGVMLIGLLGLFVDDALPRLNALRFVLASLNNAVAAIIFTVVAHVAWPAALLIAASSLVGGQIGAAVGRRLPASVLRGVIVVAGLTAVVKLVTA